MGQPINALAWAGQASKKLVQMQLGQAHAARVKIGLGRISPLGFGLAHYKKIMSFL
jgi:hypothetical protein